jgi:ribulose-5-phosphate 4-epimerase/fuculose-1-phosphate aldolase
MAVQSLGKGKTVRQRVTREEWERRLDLGINKAGYIIHSAIHEARADVDCVIHTHTVAGMAVSAMKCGLLPLAQTGLRRPFGVLEWPALLAKLDKIDPSFRD